MDDDLSPTAEWDLGHRYRPPRSETDTDDPITVVQVCSRRFEGGTRRPDVLDELRGGSSGTGFDLVVALRQPTRVLLRLLASTDTVQHPAQRISVASDVGEHVTDRPVRQQ